MGDKMAKRIKSIIYIAMILTTLSLCGYLIYVNLISFKDTSNRFLEIFDISSLKNFFENYNNQNQNILNESVTEITDGVNGMIEGIQNKFDKSFEEVILSLLSNLLDFTLNFLIYFCNYGINILLVFYITLHETISGTHLKVSISPLGRLYVIVDSFITKIKTWLKKAIIGLKNTLYYNRRFISSMVALILLSNGFLYKILVELLIFFIVYVIRMINMETYMVVFGIIQAGFTFVYPKLKYIPLWILWPIIILLIFMKAVSHAKYKLKMNHDRMKDFACDELTQTTFINGPPGTGKTLLNVALSLASEENFIEELETKLLDYEMNYKYLNFAKVREHPEDFPEHEAYTNTYKLLTTRGSFLISNYSIYSPLYNEFSKIFNFNYMRVNKPAEIYPLEEYIIVSLSEFDKEYNSHDNKKEVGEDGAATFFSTVSHDLKRHAKIFVDYQLKDQVPLRIRGNAEYFITIKKRSKKYPLLLYLYYLPIKTFYKIIRHFIKKYESKKKTITKKSLRKGQAIYKRNDITLPYAILRGIASSLKKVCDWFDGFYYFKLNCIITQEGDIGKGEKKKLGINLVDLSYKGQPLYDSTFLSYSYSQKKNAEFKDLERFSKLAPSQDELDKCNSRFYNKIRN